MKFQFNKTYFILFILLFIVEVLIATFLKTGFIRHTFGDFLVVILMYTFIKSFWNIKPMLAAIGVLIFSYIIEFLQLANLLNLLNLESNKVAILVLGSTFHITDLIAYSLGIIMVIAIEYKINNNEQHKISSNNSL